MAQKDAPIVEAAGYLGKIKLLASGPSIDKNKQEQIIRCADKTMALLSLIEQAAKEGSKILSGEAE